MEVYNSSESFLNLNNIVNVNNLNDWRKISSRPDKQGGIWNTYVNPATGERIVIRENPDGTESVFVNGKKVNKKMVKVKSRHRLQKQI